MSTPCTWQRRRELFQDCGDEDAVELAAGAACGKRGGLTLVAVRREYAANLLGNSVTLKRNFEEAAKRAGVDLIRILRINGQR